jgi:hypothetical protein
MRLHSGTHFGTPFQSRTSSLGNQEMLIQPFQGRKDASPVKLERVSFQGRIVVLIELRQQLPFSKPFAVFGCRACAHRWVDHNDGGKLLRVDAVSSVPRRWLKRVPSATLCDSPISMFQPLGLPRRISPYEMYRLREMPTALLPSS